MNIHSFEIMIALCCIISKKYIQKRHLFRGYKSLFSTKLGIYSYFYVTYKDRLLGSVIQGFAHTTGASAT